MPRLLIIIGITLLALGLVAVRAFEAALFYDPLLQFFKSGHAVRSIPEMNNSKLFLGLSLRFIINTIISIAILWLVFRKKSLLKFSIIVYALFFIICMTAFAIFYFYLPDGPHQPLFYARRFIIQPILLFLLIPAFYFFGNMTAIKQ